ncbi:hypothetical protein EOL70_10805 [Leucothrix sargassi]|nr:hypothetical protein EOL70_10805 [Leucothrix sargassi]
MGLKFAGDSARANVRLRWLLSLSISLGAISLSVSSIARADQAADLQALFLKAFGAKKKAVPSQFTVDLTIDEQPHEAVLVFNNKQQVVNRVRTEDILPQLESILKKDVFEALKEAVADTKEVTFKWLAEHDIKATYDSAALSLNLKLDPEQREPLILSLLQDISSSVRKENIIEATNVSGYLNLYTNSEFTFQEDDNFADIQLQLDGSLTIHKATIESLLTKSEDDWSLSNTYITYDEPHNLRRYRFGEVSSSQRNFQQGLSLYGASLNTDFSLDRSQESKPVASEKLILSTRSDVIVLLNNFQIERYTLAAGTYQLEDIGLSDGQNDITLKIIDSFGKETYQKSSQLFDNRLLKPELSKYSIAAGALADDETKSAVSGHFQYGLNENFTLGVDGQLVKDQVLLGADVLSVGNLGALHAGVAMSRDGEGDFGTAISGAFKSKVLRKHRMIRWELGGELRSNSFTNDISLAPSSGDESLRASGYYKASKLFNDKWNTAFTLSHNNFYGGDHSSNIDLSTSRRFGKGISFSAGLNYADDTDFSVKTQISIPLGGKNNRRKRVGVIANSKDSSVETRYEIKALNSIGKGSLSGNVIHRKREDVTEERVEGSIRMPKFDSHFSVSHVKNGSADQQQIQVGLNTSLACAGKECAITYPVEGSFALVGGPKNQDKPIALNTGNRRFIYADDEDSILPISYTALIPARGRKAVIHLDDYERERITVDEITLPFGYDPEKTEFETLTGFHHAFSFNVAGEPGTIVDGILVDTDGKPLGFKGGQWISKENKEKAIAFFSNKSGRFRIPSMPAGKYRLELHDYPKMQSLEVNIVSQEDGVQRLGDVTVRL